MLPVSVVIDRCERITRTKTGAVFGLMNFTNGMTSSTVVPSGIPRPLISF